MKIGSTMTMCRYAVTTGILYGLTVAVAQASPPPQVGQAHAFIPIFGEHTDARGKILPRLHSSPAKLMPMAPPESASAMVQEQVMEKTGDGLMPARPSPLSLPAEASSKNSTMTQEQAQQLLSIFSSY
jgi:hypothetical protein